mgnify:CR=1 FL=1
MREHHGVLTSVVRRRHGLSAGLSPARAVAAGVGPDRLTGPSRLLTVSATSIPFGNPAGSTGDTQTSHGLLRNPRDAVYPGIEPAKVPSAFACMGSSCANIMGFWPLWSGVAMVSRRCCRPSAPSPSASARTGSGVRRVVFLPSRRHRFPSVVRRFNGRYTRRRTGLLTQPVRRCVSRH